MSTRKHGSGPPKGRAINAAVHLRRMQALKLRAAGATFDEIRDTLHLSDRSVARRDVIAALRMVPAEDAEEARKLDATRLDMLHMAHWRAALAGDVRATEMVLKIMDRRARLLGLDVAPPGAADGNVFLSIMEIAALTGDREAFLGKYFEAMKTRYGDRLPEALTGPLETGAEIVVGGVPAIQETTAFEVEDDEDGEGEE